MDRIEIVRAFKHADEIHPVDIPPGTYAVAAGASNPAAGVISPRAADVALQEAWGRPLAAAPKPRAEPKAAGRASAKPAGPRSPASGPAKPSSSSPPGQA